ncbi:hypothetical protein QBC38DRAFT_489471 [Podospora fimiseda]|uniref:Zn(2)-C6 fungal-type domain-containing protein n=1 Tax=Podospora fimiseda TaxID=252190 RepID=A0AAN7BFW9_9PEZI|nr:hypothetical protein QBC38DRAFT_489471 [Podospora fimiseda]
MSPNSKEKIPRRKHHKSRYGCLECKKRHRKCDETRPICVNCGSIGLQCSFSSNRPILPASRNNTITTTQTPEQSHSSTSPTPELPDLSTERYSLVHLELLNHFQTHVLKSLGLEKMSEITALTMNEAFATPFLMDQLLAISAAHKSTLPDTGRQKYYRTEATRLQTRALAQFNETPATMSAENPMPIFLYSTFLGQHVLYDTLHQISSHAGDMEALLDKMAQCLSIHHGIAQIAGHSWEELVPRLPSDFEAHKERHCETTDLANNPDSECYGLMQLLRKTQMDESSIHACCTAVERLQQLINAQESGINLVQEWPVRVPNDFINLVKQGRPESLAVLAHYSVLLHQARDSWVIGNAGGFLIQLICSHLGENWAAWLEWPLSCISST